MWGTLAEVARQLLVAWEEHFRKLVPAGIESYALVTVVCRGKLTVAAMVPAGMVSSKSAKAPAELREVVLQVWPAMMVVMREVNPRDTSAEAELLNVAVNAFDPAHAGADPIENLVAPAFKEMSSRFGRYLASGGVEPTWESVVERTAMETVLNFTLKSALPKLAATPPQQQMTTEQLQAVARGGSEI